MSSVCKAILGRGALFVALCASLCIAHAAAQSNQQQQKKNQNKWEGQRPTPSPSPGRTTTRTDGGRRGTQAAAPRKVPLTLQWRLLKFTDDGLRQVASLDDDFSLHDHLSLAVKVTQSGYLYVIRQNTPGAEGQVLFPSRYYNDGRDYVRQGQEFILPSNCADISIPCWFNLQPHSPKETLTLIFSRGPVKGLPNYNSANAAALPVKPAFLYGLQQTGAKQQLERTSVVQRLPKTAGIPGERFTTVTLVQNSNASDGNGIIETLTLNKASSVNTAGAPRKD
jgi:hypothetical protein